MKFEKSYIVQRLATKLQSCADTGKDFKLSLNQVLALFENLEVCPYSGRKFSTTRGTPNIPSFERINPEKGYEPGNVIIVTKVANNDKGQLDAFMKGTVIKDEMKVKLMRKAIYQLEKRMKEKEK